MKTPIYLLDHKLSWKTFKLLQEKLVRDAGPSAVNLDRVLWRMLREKSIYCWFDANRPYDMGVGVKLPEKRDVVVIKNPKKEFLEEVKKILVDEINITHAHPRGKTSGLTSAYNRISKLQ